MIEKNMDYIYIYIYCSRKQGRFIGYPKEEKKTWIIGIMLYVAIPLIYYLATLNNFVGLMGDDIAQLLIIYLV